MFCQSWGSDRILPEIIPRLEDCTAKFSAGSPVARSANALITGIAGDQGEIGTRLVRNPSRGAPWPLALSGPRRAKLPKTNPRNFRIGMYIATSQYLPEDRGTVVSHPKSLVFQLAEVAVSLSLFAAIVERIGRLWLSCVSG
jgi:hypothetical protein